jgi:hypothetical protein
VRGHGCTTGPRSGSGAVVDAGEASVDMVSVWSTH